MVVYPPSVAAGTCYEDLLPLVQDIVRPTSGVYLLGWSFGGPLALMAAAASPEKIRGIILAATRVSARVIAVRIRAALEVDVRRLLRESPHPLLYVASSKDYIVSRRNLDDLLTARPSTHVVTMDGGHLAMYTAPAPAARAIADLIVACDSRDVFVAGKRLCGAGLIA